MSKLFFSAAVLLLCLGSCGETCETCTYTKKLEMFDEDGSVGIITIDSVRETYCDNELEGVKYNEGTNTEGLYIVSFDCE